MEIMSNQVKRILMGLAMEIAVNFFFLNFTYTFGGNIFVQMFGGPIGARITMAVAKLVLQEWKDEYNNILAKSDITEYLSGLYIDDGRSHQRLLRRGERFNLNRNKFTFDEYSEKEDIEAGISKEDLTRREVLKAMNSVNKDLEFTMELCSDFVDLKLPTLSFSLYMSDKGIEHTYYEKSMKNQILVMERSALSRQQIMRIMTNEVRRRVEVIGANVSQNEANEIMN